MVSTFDRDDRGFKHLLLIVNQVDEMACLDSCPSPRNKFFWWLCRQNLLGAPTHTTGHP